MRTYDIVVAGAGIAGLALALGLKRACPGAGICIVDPSGLPQGTEGRRNLRAVAVAAGSRRLLDDLGVWGEIEASAQPIVTMRITDSRPEDHPRSAYLDFSGEAEPGESFAHMLFQDDLRQALARACHGAGIEGLRHQIAGFRDERHALAVDLPGLSLRTRLLVAADGGRSRLRGFAGIGAIGWDYHQAAVVATIAHERSHEGRAIQHFLPSGPLALLPLRSDDGAPLRLSLVWTESTAEAGRLVSLPARDFLDRLEQRIGYDFGALRLEDSPGAHPLRLTLPRRLVASRFALIGDAARVIHPLAGQGLNLGLRDVAVLAEGLTEPLDLGLDPGNPEVLRAYERARRFDSMVMAASTDALNRLFSTDSLPVRLARDLGLGLVDRLPALKRFLIKDAAGLSGDRPALLRR